jgi:hypothetical protein
MKDWIEKPIKRMLRKWLLKKVYSEYRYLSCSLEFAEWIYNSPLNEWSDKLWCFKQSLMNPKLAHDLYDKYLKSHFY